MDMELKRGLRERLLKFAPVYGLDGLVPEATERGGSKEGWGFVRCWGWKACLSAIDVGVVLGAILEVGSNISPAGTGFPNSSPQLPPTPQSLDSSGSQGFLPDAPKFDDEAAQDAITSRFWTAYDSLSSPTLITQHIPIAQHLHRAILRTGTALIAKHQIRHLRAFRMAVVKEGPDAPLFTHAGALVKLALWVAEAVAEMEGKKARGGGSGGSELVLAGLDEARGVYVVVGLGGGGTTVQSKEKEKRRAERRKRRDEKREARRREKAAERQRALERRLANGEEVDEDDDDEDVETEEEDSSESESEDEADEAEEGRRGAAGRNRFGIAFQEVIEETGARVKVDSFEHCVVEVRKEDLSGFLEQLSMKAIVG
ncbi:dna replication initiation factor cdc45 [Neofusicoccum parvum]|nr:dna replication initiation factor cdc45 [Neofusicoccum parvum]